MKLRGSMRFTMLGAAALLLLLTSCLKLNMNLKISSDNTASGSIIFAFDKQLIALSGQSVDDLLSQSGAGSGLPSDLPGATTKDYEDDTFVGKEYAFSGVPLTEFTGSSDELKIVRDGDVFRVTGTMDLSSGTGATGDPTADATLEEAMKKAELSITIEFPGAVSESSGEIDGNKVTWTPTIGEVTELTATASAIGSGSSSSSMLIIIAVVVLALIVGAVVMMRKKKAAPAMAADAGMGATATDPMAAPAAPMASEPPPAPPVPPADGTPPAPPAES